MLRKDLEIQWGVGIADPGRREPPGPPLAPTSDSLWFANTGQTGGAIVYKGWGLVQFKLAPCTKAI